MLSLHLVMAIYTRVKISLDDYRPWEDPNLVVPVTRMYILGRQKMAKAATKMYPIKGCFTSIRNSQQVYP